MNAWEMSPRDPRPGSVDAATCFGWGAGRSERQAMYAIPLGRRRLGWMPAAVLPPLEQVGLDGDLSRLEESVRRNRLEHRFVRVSLAVRRFADQKGVLPSRVDDLVPEYLAAVPVNPGFGPNRIEILAAKRWGMNWPNGIVLFTDARSSNNLLDDRVYYTHWGSLIGLRPGGTDPWGRQWRDVMPYSPTEHLGPVEPQADKATP